MRHVLLATAAAIQFAFASGANASEATARIDIHAYVPVICHADFESIPSVTASGEMRLGAIHEFCNAGSGYQVVVEYAPTRDPGALLVDGRFIPLDGSGRTVIQQVSGPALETRSLGYLPGHQPISSLHISLQTTAI